MSEDISLRASQDLFDDSLTPENNQEQENKTENIAWRGVALSSLKLNRYDLIPSVVPSSFHTVTFKLPVENGICPAAYPKVFQDTWDNSHVQLPCSKRNFVYISEEKRVQAWPMIKERLQANISCARDLQQAISSYSWRKVYQKWSFGALHKFLSETLSEPESDYFFDTVFPDIVNLALSLDSEVTCAIPLLRRRKSFNLSITQHQAACLLANAFLCTFPERNFAKESYPYPSFNFTRLFTQGGDLTQEKLKCFINYFRHACSTNLEGVISFSRRSINPANLPSWFTSNKLFTNLHISSEGTIEDEGQGMLQIDFANKFVGGGVLGYGSLQEEITFLLCPELIVSRLFTEYLDDTEALIITGAERFNKHTGYGDGFKWAGAYDDSSTPVDSFKRKCRTIVALDALRFSNKSLQYKPEAIFREINKAYCGFSFGCDGKDKICIATGNWGCGAFRGDPKLKALIQLIAAAQSDRNLVYFTFFDNELKNSIFDAYTFLIRNNITVGQLCSALSKYQAYLLQIGDIPLYDYLYSTLLDLDTVAALINSEAEENIIDVNTSPPESAHSVVRDEEESEDQEQDNKLHINDISMEESTDSELNKNISTSETTMEDSVMELTLPASEPIPAETYSIKTEEGRKRCLESERERWKAYENAKTRLTPSSVGTPKSSAKKKISDYFAKTPKRT